MKESVLRYLVCPECHGAFTLAVEARDEVVRLLKGLAPRERAAIVLTQILDLPTEEAGRMLGIKASTIRVLTMRARAHLRAKAVELP